MLPMKRRRRTTLREHCIRGLLVLSLLLHPILVRIILPLLLEFQAFLASTADLLRSLRLVLKLGRAWALWWPGRGHQWLPIFVAVRDYC